MDARMRALRMLVGVTIIQWGFDLVDGVGQVNELGVVAVELGLLDLNEHLVVLVASLRAGVLLVHMLRAATVIENGDL